MGAWSYDSYANDNVFEFYDDGRGTVFDSIRYH